MLDGNPFDNFLAISNWIFDQTGQTHQINLKRLFELISQAIEALFPKKHQAVIMEMEKDHAASKLKGYFEHLKLHAGKEKVKSAPKKVTQRQQRHMS